MFVHDWYCQVMHSIDRFIHVLESQRDTCRASCGMCFASAISGSRDIGEEECGEAQFYVVYRLRYMEKKIGNGIKMEHIFGELEIDLVFERICDPSISSTPSMNER